MKRKSWKFWQQPLTRRERRVLRWGAALVALALLYAYVQLPLWSGLGAARAERTLQQSRRQTGADAAARLPQQEAAVADLREATATAAAGLPAGKAEPQLLRDLNGLATGSGVKVLELSFGAPAAVDGLTAYPFHLSVGGGEVAARQFLASLEKAGRVVQVKSFSYQVQNQTLSLEAVTFADPGAGQK